MRLNKKLFVIVILFFLSFSILLANPGPILTLEDGTTWVEANEENSRTTIFDIFTNYGGGIKYFWNPDIYTNLSVLCSIISDSYETIPGDYYTVDIEYSRQRSDDFTQRRIGYTVRVEDDYTINLPNLGSFDVSRMTYKTLRKTLIETYQSLMYPDYVNVVFSRPAQFVITIHGEVNKPGVILVNSMMRIVDAIGVAGGFTGHANYRSIEVRHADGSSQVIDMMEYLFGNNTGTKLRLRADDSIFVSKAQKQVTISGSVLYPGVYELSNDEDINDLIEYAGGLRLEADKTAFNLTRYETSGNKKVEQYTDMNPAVYPDVALEHGDAVHIFSAAYNSPFITVEGAIFGHEYTESVPIPDTSQLVTLPYYEGMDLRAALNSCGGPTPYASGNECVVFRKNASGNMLTVGIEEVMSGDSQVLIQPGDRVLVPMQKRVVVMSGEVNDPGTIDYSYNRGLSYYVLSAGGLTDLGDKDRIYLVGQDGKFRKRIDYDYIPQPADMLYVDKRAGRDLYEGTYNIVFPAILTTVEIAASVASIIATVISIVADQNSDTD